MKILNWLGYHLRRSWGNKNFWPWQKQWFNQETDFQERMRSAGSTILLITAIVIFLQLLAILISILIHAMLN